MIYPMALVLMMTAATVTGAIVGVEVQPREVTVGDPVEVVIQLNVPGTSDVLLPPPDSFKPADLIRVDTSRTTAGAFTARFTIALFEPGIAELPDLPMVFVDSYDNDTLWAELGQVKVSSLLAESDSLTDIRDVKPPLPLPIQWRDIAPYIIGGAIALILILAFWLIWRRLKGKVAGELNIAAPSVPPHITALERLEELRLKRLWQNGYLKEYHSELTDIIKDYIGASYDFNAPEMTTEELLSERRLWKADDEGYNLIRRILTVADLVKFAKYTADPSSNEASLNAAFRYVELTRPRELSVNAGNNNAVVGQVG